MLLISSSAAMARALDSPLDPALRVLLLMRQAQLTEHDLAETAHFLIVEEGDALSDVERELGFSPLTNPIDGMRYGDPDFSPFWEWIQDHQGWFELVFIFSDEGSAQVVLIKDEEGTNASLLSLCREQTATENIQNEQIGIAKGEDPEASQSIPSP